MSDLPNVFYKKTDTAEELHKIIEHLQARVVELSKEVETLSLSNKDWRASNQRMAQVIQSHTRDQEKIANAAKIYELAGTLKAIWEES